MASGIATVKEVISGDTLVLVGAPKGGPPPEKRVGLSCVVAPRVALKSLTHESPDEPYGWPARELMRHRLIGQQVEFKVEYSIGEKEYACVRFQGENVACELLRRGLARLKENRNNNNIQDLQALEECEAEAKAKQLGVHSADSGSSTVRTIKWAVGEADFIAEFVEKHKGKQLPAIVEYVRDAGSFRLAIRTEEEDESHLSFVYCSLSLSGILCPGLRRSPEGKTVAEPFAAEGRFFVEIRLLNRDVSVRVEGSDDYGNMLGTLLHPKGDISLLLLSNGFAKVNNATVGLTEQPNKLRQAMKEAQTNKLRRWKDFSSSVSTDSLERVYAATVEEVFSGDSILLRLPDGSSRRVYFASIRCNRPSSAAKPQPREDEALALEAKELVRKKTIGKMVKVFLEYVRALPSSSTGGAAPPASDSKGNMHFVSVYVGSLKLLGIEENDNGLFKASQERRGQNVSELLLQAGLAKTTPHRAEDDQAERYDAYQALEKEAQAAKKGLFAAPSSVKVVRMVDLTGPANAQRAAAHLQQLQRSNKLDAIVENVYNAGRFKLRIPSQALYLTFALSGVRCPQTFRAAVPGGPKERQGEALGNEALQFTRERVLQREVYIQVLQCDRGGSFIGLLHYDKNDINIALELLEEGLAQTIPFSLSRTPSKELYIEAENKAKKHRKGLWSLEGAFDEETETEETFAEKQLNGVVVSHIERFDLFYIQEERNDRLDEIAEEIDKTIESASSIDCTFTRAGLPKKGEVVLGLHAADGAWYRARVEKREGDKAVVLFVDFGVKETLAAEQLRRLSPSLSLSSIPPQATPCTLSGLLPPPDLEEDAADALHALTKGVVFHCLIENINKDKNRLVVLTSEEDYSEKRPSVNEKLLGMGLALFDKKSNAKYASRFAAEEEKARKMHLNVWRYGDIGAEEDDEDFPSLSHKRAPPRR